MLFSNVWYALCFKCTHKKRSLVFKSRESGGNFFYEPFPKFEFEIILEYVEYHHPAENSILVIRRD